MASRNPNHVDHFGLPFCIKGGENVTHSICLNILVEDVVDRSSVISGSSVHNQRLERLRRDLYSGVSVLLVLLTSWRIQDYSMSISVRTICTSLCFYACDSEAGLVSGTAQTSN